MFINNKLIGRQSVNYDVPTNTTGYIGIPVGTTAQKPDNPPDGAIRVTDTSLTKVLEIYSASSGAWIEIKTIYSSSASVEYLIVGGGGGGGDFGIGVDSLDHHNASYYHLNNSCGGNYLYQYGAGYKSNAALSGFISSPTGCDGSDTNAFGFLVAMK